MTMRPRPPTLIFLLRTQFPVPGSAFQINLSRKTAHHGESSFSLLCFIPTDHWCLRETSFILLNFPLHYLPIFHYNLLTYHIATLLHSYLINYYIFKHGFLPTETQVQTFSFKDIHKCLQNGRLR
ncbi:hypothetical protein BT96DRAFT_32522 [Gymnopus androsaceus JB14]|uniref:Uncharacterized protein n=1 Tax=Gymnopus androsaceus JB14 TaxID=1447944 RepID=A0A6A4HIX6_9AGAR|nr:hypothetical protein BT96DRAFT_32522 [Gymnopus androsaceus JB14]